MKVEIIKSGWNGFGLYWAGIVPDNLTAKEAVEIIRVLMADTELIAVDGGEEGITFIKDDEWEIRGKPNIYLTGDSFNEDAIIRVIKDGEVLAIGTKFGWQY